MEAGGGRPAPESGLEDDDSTVQPVSTIEEEILAYSREGLSPAEIHTAISGPGVKLTRGDVARIVAAARA